MIIVVGAGLAGLTCAKILAQAGRDVLVVEAGDGPGGRVRSDRQDGFILDRGFQVLFTAYPAVRQHLDLEALMLRPFAPGAIIAQADAQGKQRHYTLTDPFRDHRLAQLAATVANPLISFGDKLRVAALRRDVAQRTVADIFQSTTFGDRATSEELLARGFSSDGFIDQFVRPFYGGIFLNRDLHTSARMFLFTFKMLAEGATVVPAHGTQAIADQLARHLPDGALRLNSRVRDVIIEGGRAQGVRLDDDTILEGEAVVLAVDAVTAKQLAEVAIPASAQPVAATCVYFSSPASLYDEAVIVLNANPDAMVNHVVQLSNVAPSYAPEGHHLISATVLGQPSLDDATLYARCRADIGKIFPHADVAALQPLRIYRIPMAQFDQPPGIYTHLPTNTTAIQRLYIAGEYTESSSIHGAMHSGEKAARLL